MFKPKILNIHTTTACTLRCAKCANHIPSFEKNNPIIANLGKISSSLPILFDIYTYIPEIRLNGGEAFLYPDLVDILLALEKYRDKFSHVVIVTNGSYIPQSSLLDSIANLNIGLIVRVDNYGELSKRYSECVHSLKQYGIEVDERSYYEDNQAFGGWIDVGDFTRKNYSDSELRRIFNNCRLAHGEFSGLYDDKLIFCCQAAFADMLGRASLADDDFILLTKDKSISDLRSEAQTKCLSPYEACKYCNGFDPINGKRFPAAEQLTG